MSVDDKSFSVLFFLLFASQALGRELDSLKFLRMFVHACCSFTCMWRSCVSMNDVCVTSAVYGLVVVFFTFRGSLAHDTPLGLPERPSF